MGHWSRVSVAGERNHLCGFGHCSNRCAKSNGERNRRSKCSDPCNRKESGLRGPQDSTEMVRVIRGLG